MGLFLMIEYKNLDFFIVRMQRAGDWAGWNKGRLKGDDILQHVKRQFSSYRVPRKQWKPIASNFLMPPLKLSNLVLWVDALFP